MAAPDRELLVRIDFGWSTDATPPPVGATLEEPRAQVGDGLRAS